MLISCRSIMEEMESDKEMSLQVSVLSMANTFKPLLHLSPPVSRKFSPGLPWISCKLISDVMASPPPIFTSGRRRQVAASVSFNPSGNFNLSFPDDDDGSVRAPPPMPPTEDRFEVVLDNDVISRLDLSPFQTATGIVSPISAEPKEFLERRIGFTITYRRDDLSDFRELSEFPDIRLWFVRLDAAYPWLPVVLDWRSGELARYAAMLVPHQISMKMGVVFNPEALELFVMKKVFTVYSWLKHHGIAKPRLRTSDMARMLGFGIGDELYDLVDQHPLLPHDLSS